MPVLTPAALHLKCRIVLDHVDENRVLGFPSAHIELTNCSADVIEIECPSHPLEHLNLAVTNEAGELVSRGKYGNMLIRARLDRMPPLRIQAGETTKWHVSLMGSVPAEREKPGTYTIQAIYEYGSLKAVSEPVQIEYVAP
jgi:hypothetical protein